MHLLVDGWNVIHSNQRMMKLFKEVSQDIAVEALYNALSPIHDADNIRVTLVFDGKGDTIEIVRKTRLTTYSEVYTPSSMSADDFIEQYCSIHGQDCTVATRDNLLALTVSSYGAQTVSPDYLFEWAASCAKRITRKSAEISEKSKLKWKESNPFRKLK